MTATLLHRRTGLEAEGTRVVSRGPRPKGRDHAERGSEGGNAVTYHVAGDRDLMYAERWKFVGNEFALSDRP